MRQVVEYNQQVQDASRRVGCLPYLFLFARTKYWGGGIGKAPEIKYTGPQHTMFGAEPESVAPAGERSWEVANRICAGRVWICGF